MAQHKFCTKRIQEITLQEPQTRFLPIAPTPQQYFNEVFLAFQKAEKTSASSIVRSYKINNLTINLRFANQLLLPYFTSALEHLATENCSNPDLAVCIWDSTSTNSPSIPPPISLEDYHPLGEVRGSIGDFLKIDYKCASNTLSILDTQRNLGIFWIQDPQNISPAESAVPLKHIIHWWSQKHGYQLLHAGAVGSTDGAVLLVGKGGSGKSTTTTSCLFSGMYYLGDDNVLVRNSSNPTVYCLYNSAKLDPDSIRRLSTLIPPSVIPKTSSIDKEIFFFYKYYPKQLPLSLPLKAILIPKISGRKKAQLVPTSSGNALKALAPSTITLLSGAGPKEFRDIAKLVSQIPCYELELSNSPVEIPGLIIQLLNKPE